MPKKCELTGKRPLKGHKVSHANNKVKRRFLPSVKKVSFKSELLNKKLNSDIPIALKVSPDIDNAIVKDISKILIEYKVNALIVSNTTDQNRDSLKDHQKFQKGGLSGKPLNDISNKLINNFFKNLNGQIKIIGVGGVDSGETAYKKFLSGANFVQLYTGMVFRGPKIAIKINEELKKILKEKKIKNYSDIIGKL